VLDARRAGFNVSVVTDAVAGISPEGTARALEEMRLAGARLVSSRDLPGV
jgi:nicotinamidase/pyrazinamidase